MRNTLKSDDAVGCVMEAYALVIEDELHENAFRAWAEALAGVSEEHSVKILLLHEVEVVIQ